MPELSVLIASALAIAVSMGLLWLVSLPLRNSSIVDIFWGLGFVMVAWLGFALGRGATQRVGLMAVLITVWGVRLSAYLAWRNVGKGEDRRYAAMRQSRGHSWWWRSLFIVFGLQGGLMFVISLPIQVVVCAPQPHLLTWLDFMGAAVVLLGVLFEATADWQLARFKARDANRGQVMRSGLWRYTRHPNYFGDFLVWWGLYAIALATGAGGWTVVSPLLMTLLLLRVSGVPLLEQTLKDRPGYDAYARSTNAFFPWPPRRG